MRMLIVATVLLLVVQQQAKTPIQTAARDAHDHSTSTQVLPSVSNQRNVDRQEDCDECNNGKNHGPADPPEYMTVINTIATVVMALFTVALCLYVRGQLLA